MVTLFESTDPGSYSRASQKISIVPGDNDVFRVYGKPVTGGEINTGPVGPVLDSPRKQPRDMPAAVGTNAVCLLSARLIRLRPQGVR